MFQKQKKNKAAQSRYRNLDDTQLTRFGISQIICFKTKQNSAVVDQPETIHCSIQ